MRVDQEFEGRVEASSFSRQQWGLVMTATEFEIENPTDPEQARLVADTSSLSSVMGEIENMDGQGGGGMGAMSGGGARGGASGSGGIFSSITDALPFGGGNGGDSALAQEATELANEYAEKLQERLEERGRWQAVCKQASGN
jgi:hypothetical protein